MNRLKALRRCRRGRTVDIYGRCYRIIIRRGKLMMKTDARDWSEKGCIIDHDDRTIVVSDDMTREGQEETIREAIELTKLQIETGDNCRPIPGWHFPEEPDPKSKRPLQTPHPVKAESQEVAVAKEHIITIPIAKRDYSIIEATAPISDCGEQTHCRVDHATCIIWISPRLSRHNFCLVVTHALAKAFQERCIALADQMENGSF